MTRSTPATSLEWPLILPFYNEANVIVGAVCSLTQLTWACAELQDDNCSDGPIAHARIRGAAFLDVCRAAPEIGSPFAGR